MMMQPYATGSLTVTVCPGPMVNSFAPKYWPEAIIKFANSRGSDKVLYGGYFPMGLELTRIFAEMDEVPFKPEVWPKFLRDNAAKVLGIAV